MNGAVMINMHITSSIRVARHIIKNKRTLEIGVKTRYSIDDNCFRVANNMGVIPITKGTIQINVMENRSLKLKFSVLEGMLNTTRISVPYNAPVIIPINFINKRLYAGGKSINCE
ncbi:hypothetical protein DJ568_06865 [Mucilaginibacter hurinus]|uniref:Uncharacterized protein n=1 Tax=Mucilaginibacter hurinus TaxID=2201324 RepID=A0A367GRB6_9SPHI|nr:hypothetical protein DJ568_06865 [Mucilaginibacter hurinus]